MSILFRPWIGDEYREDGFRGKRVLILGESHYEWLGWDQKVATPAEVTNYCIREQLDGTETKAFWTNIVIAFLNRRPTLDEKRSFWQSVAFYNYVQAFVGSDSRVRPGTQMWRDSSKPLSEALELLQPQSIIVLGYDLWKNLPTMGERGPKVVGAPREETWWYPVDHGTRALAYGIRHPSSGFSGPTWHPHIMKAIKLA